MANSEMTVETLLASLLPKVASRFRNEAECDQNSILTSVESGVREAFANGAQIEQVKEAPARSRQIFKNFRDATVALLACDDTPKGVDHAVFRMLDEFNNELGGNDESASVNAYRVMTSVFELDGKEAPEAEDDEAEAEETAKALAEAFAVIEQYRDYLPDGFYRRFDDDLGDWIANANWTSDPRLIREMLPLVLRKLFIAEEEDEDE